MAVIEALSLGLNVEEVIINNYSSWGSFEELKKWEEKNYI